jgi:hypothetical protein
MQATVTGPDSRVSETPRNAGDTETRVVVLITQRSRVQIPPPLLVFAGQSPFPAGRGPFA